MKLLKLKSFAILLITITVLFFQSPDASATDGRVKALGTMALYGTAGGALLGAASLAFGTSGRAVAQGASLGLYAGIVFGTYVVVSHSLKQRRYRSPEPAPPAENYYPDDGASPYQDANNGAGSSSDSWSFYNRMESMKEYSLDFGLDMKSVDRLRKRNGPDRPAFYMNLLNFQF
ncbi:hypothetical protein A9Q84_17380 [Halobacteriovorax marinus]|uniref:Transmembrane protein n=1 Tax=Halobacteriovorax marinus TaxID=97084 RepID=A0A1Y5F419_9BACT|nr:hypothetical protein A9Q84_17380 [Halobacteriovorax marinus]